MEWNELSTHIHLQSLFIPKFGLQQDFVNCYDAFLASDLQLNVVSATTDVHDWQALAQQLDYDPVHQQELQTSGRNQDQCRKEMLTSWVRKDQRASWKKLAEALDRMEQEQVARRIREEFIPHQGMVKTSV